MELKDLLYGFLEKFSLRDMAGKIQYSPKIMHTQEEVQEVLGPQEHAGHRKK